MLQSSATSASAVRSSVAGSDGSQSTSIACAEMPSASVFTTRQVAAAIARSGCVTDSAPIATAPRVSTASRTALGPCTCVIACANQITLPSGWMVAKVARSALGSA